MYRTDVTVFSLWPACCRSVTDTARETSTWAIQLFAVFADSCLTVFLQYQHMITVFTAGYLFILPLEYSWHERQRKKKKKKTPARTRSGHFRICTRTAFVVISVSTNFGKLYVSNDKRAFFIYLFFWLLAASFAKRKKNRASTKLSKSNSTKITMCTLKRRGHRQSWNKRRETARAAWRLS